MDALQSSRTEQPTAFGKLLQPKERGPLFSPLHNSSDVDLQAVIAGYEEQMRKYEADIRLHISV